MFELTDELKAAMKAHAAAEYPKEACGIVAGGEYIRIKNMAKDTTQDFRLPDDIFLDYSPEAVFHSHPDEPDYPTASDMQSQIVTNVPWILCVAYKSGNVTEPFAWGGGYIPPLVGRQYRHGPSGTDNKGDCYAIIKDWYKLERDIDLPEFPRDENWWANGENLYSDGFAKAGFQEIKPENEPQVGDVAFMAIRSQVINHAAVYVGNGMFLQQLCQRISRHEPACRWARIVKRLVRYVNEKDISPRVSE